MPEVEWSVAWFPQRCDNHVGMMPEGTPYRIERAPGRYRRVCSACVTRRTPDQSHAGPSLALVEVSAGISPCPHCGTAPPAGEPWATVLLGSTAARACLDCWSRWAQGLPLGERR